MEEEAEAKRKLQKREGGRENMNGREKHRQVEQIAKENMKGN